MSKGERGSGSAGPSELRQERSGYRAAGHDVEKAPRQPLPPLATGIALGLWIAVMLFLGFVVVPTAFGSCTGGLPAP